MTLQAKLTLGSVLLATLIVGLISVVDLANDIQRQFDVTLERADLLKRVATKMVVQALDRRRTVPLREALRDPDLTSGLIDFGAASRVVFEIAVLSAENEVLADSDPSRLGVTSPPYPDFRPVVAKASWWSKIQLLRQNGRYYQLQEPLGFRESGARDTPLLYVRVIIEPALIRNDILPTIRNNANVALASIAGAVLITFLFSAVAFRPLGQLDQMLDRVAKGELEPDKMSPTKAASRDEVSVIATKVSLLGQRLRGAQYEVSDLRGNFERLLQDLEDAVLIFNRDRRLVFASGSLEKFLGRSQADLGGQLVSEIFPPSTTLGLLVAQTAQTGRPIRNRRVPSGLAVSHAEAVAVVLLSVDQLESLPGAPNSGAGLLVRLRDPEATRKLGRELQTADRLAAISRISGGVAHEVKNPLNAILLHVEVARAKLARGDNDVADQMEIISREILRLDRVVKTFLDFTRPVELSFSTVPLHDFFGELLDLARPQAEASGIRVFLDEQVEGVEVRIDRDLMKQALLNIVVNALEAMPAGGELRFEGRLHDDAAEIRISDTGSGIAPALRDKIFSLYFTTKQSGSGIGLAMTFRIIQLHDGTIDFTSEPGKGTSFLVRLPAAV
jgi:signal transduction histidine kinase